MAYLKHLNLRVDDYGAFYRHVFEQSVQYWGRTFADGAQWPTAQHSRIYWYVVGKMDEWDLNDPKAEARLRTRFEMNPRLRDAYIEDASRRLPDLPLDRRIEEAWNLCFSETREWYESKRRALERKKRFYHGVQAATDFVEIRQEGHWKVDLLHHTVNEKGLDTSLAVDMVALQDTYDIALLISGDADGIPGHQLRQEPVEARRRRRVSPRFAGRLPDQGDVVAAQDRRRLRRAGLRVRPAAAQPRLPVRDRLCVGLRTRRSRIDRHSSTSREETIEPWLALARSSCVLPEPTATRRPPPPGNGPGPTVETWHVDRLIESPAELDRFQILTIPGGFSYGDDLGAGRILATRLRDRAGRRPAAVSRPGRTDPGYLQRVPGPGPQRPPARRARSRAPRRWLTTIRAVSRPAGCGSRPGRAARRSSSFTEPIELPVAHGEGKFLTAEPAALDRLRTERPDRALRTPTPAGSPRRNIRPIPTAPPRGIAGASATRPAGSSA